MPETGFGPSEAAARTAAVGKFGLENRRSCPLDPVRGSSRDWRPGNLVCLPAGLRRRRQVLVLAALVSAGACLFLSFQAVQGETARHHLTSFLQNAGDKQADPVQSAAQPVTFSQASNIDFDGKLVSISGTLISQFQDTQSSTILIQSSGRLVTGYLNQKALFPKYPAGSIVRISGFCRLVPGEGSRPARLSQVEMRSPADFALVARSSWFTLQHILYIVLALSIVGLIFTVRAAFLKWQSVNQTAWIDRSMMVARERSRILEMISANRPLGESLAEICKSAEELLPGTVCRHSLEIGRESLAVAREQEQTVPIEKPLYEMALQDEESNVHGSIAVFCHNPRSLAADREDIFKLLSELGGNGPAAIAALPRSCVPLHA